MFHNPSIIVDFLWMTNFFVIVCKSSAGRGLVWGPLGYINTVTTALGFILMASQ